MPRKITNAYYPHFTAYDDSTCGGDSNLFAAVSLGRVPSRGESSQSEDSRSDMDCTTTDDNVSALGSLSQFSSASRMSSRDNNRILCSSSSSTLSDLCLGAVDRIGMKSQLEVESRPSVPGELSVSSESSSEETSESDGISEGATRPPRKTKSRLDELDKNSRTSNHAENVTGEASDIRENRSKDPKNKRRLNSEPYVGPAHSNVEGQISHEDSSDGSSSHDSLDHPTNQKPIDTRHEAHINAEPPIESNKMEKVVDSSTRKHSMDGPLKNVIYLSFFEEASNNDDVSTVCQLTKEAADDIFCRRMIPLEIPLEDESSGELSGFTSGNSSARALSVLDGDVSDDAVRTYALLGARDDDDERDGNQADEDLLFSSHDEEEDDDDLRLWNVNYISEMEEASTNRDISTVGVMSLSVAKEAFNLDGIPKDVEISPDWCDDVSTIHGSMFPKRISESGTTETLEDDADAVEDLDSEIGSEDAVRPMKREKKVNHEAISGNSDLKPKAYHVKQQNKIKISNGQSTPKSKRAAAVGTAVHQPKKAPKKVKKHDKRETSKDSLREDDIGRSDERLEKENSPKKTMKLEARRQLKTKVGSSLATGQVRPPDEKQPGQKRIGDRRLDQQKSGERKLMEGQTERSRYSDGKWSTENYADEKHVSKKPSSARQNTKSRMSVKQAEGRQQTEKPSSERHRVDKQSTEKDSIERKSPGKTPLEKRRAERQLADRKSNERQPLPRKLVEKSAIAKKAVEKPSNVKKSSDKKSSERKIAPKKLPDRRTKTASTDDDIGGKGKKKTSHHKPSVTTVLSDSQRNATSSPIRERAHRTHSGDALKRVKKTNADSHPNHHNRTNVTTKHKKHHNDNAAKENDMVAKPMKPKDPKKKKHQHHKKTNAVTDETNCKQQQKTKKREHGNHDTKKKSTGKKKVDQRFMLQDVDYLSKVDIASTNNDLSTAKGHTMSARVASEAFGLSIPYEIPIQDMEDVSTIHGGGLVQDKAEEESLKKPTKKIPLETIGDIETGFSKSGGNSKPNKGWDDLSSASSSISQMVKSVKQESKIMANKLRHQSVIAAESCNDRFGPTWNKIKLDCTTLWHKHMDGRSTTEIVVVVFISVALFVLMILLVAVLAKK